MIVLPLLVATIVGGAAVGAGYDYYSDMGDGVDSPEDAIAARGGGARIFDRTGVLLYEFLDEEYGLQERISLDQVSPWVIKATIASEDASFYSNPGINVRGLVRAATENVRPGDEFLQGTGGSSITQQLVKQLYFTKEEREERNISRKVKEAVLAVRITRDYDKDQILEWYLNEIPYGGVLIGIQTASEGYFGVPASELSLGQAAFLAGLPQSPGTYDPFTNMRAAKARQHDVIELMVKHEHIDEEMGAWAKLEVIELNPKPRPFLAPHWVQYVADHIRATYGTEALLHGGLNVVTTLDLKMNTEINQILEKYLQLYEASSRGHNGSVVVINPPTGEILAMVGSRDYFRDDIDGRVNNAIAVNSPGSTLKPFTYAAAINMGWSPEWPIVDTAITWREEGSAAFSPRNPDGRNRGVMPLKQALGNSFNIPAFKTILWTGVDEMLATAKAMGITTLDRDLGPATTLGGVDVKLIDMVYGYSTFANNGVMAGIPTTQPRPEGNRALDPNPVIFITNRRGNVIVNNAEPSYDYVIDPAVAYLISDILAADENRAITYGRGSNLNIPGHKVAVKTGTSEPYETRGLIGETWTIGYTPDVAVGVWVGNSDNTPMVNISSATVAGGVWHETMVMALEVIERRDWVGPDDIVTATVCVPSGIPVTPGVNCPSVTGRFAKKALDAQGNGFWGGQLVSVASPATIPAEVTGWRRYLAEEYMTYRQRITNVRQTGPGPQIQQPAQPPPQQQPAPPPAAPEAPPPPPPAPEEPPEPPQ